MTVHVWWTQLEWEKTNGIKEVCEYNGTFMARGRVDVAARKVGLSRAELIRVFVMDGLAKAR